MNKKAVKIGVFCGSLIGTTFFVYAITSLFFTKSERSDLSKKKVFQFDLSTDMAATEVGPGDSFEVKPVVYNDATEEMYVFIQVEMQRLKIKHFIRLIWMMNGVLSVRMMEQLFMVMEVLR